MSIQLELTQEEARILSEYLDEQLTELQTETFRTDAFEYKDMLKHRQAVIEGINRRLKLAHSAEPAA